MRYLLMLLFCLPLLASAVEFDEFTQSLPLGCEAALCIYSGTAHLQVSRLLRSRAGASSLATKADRND